MIRHWKYRIATSSNLNEVVDSTATLDAAFHRAAELSNAKDHFGSVICVYSSEDVDRDGGKRVRIFAKAGRARWAKDCTSKVYGSSHYGCRTCGGLGLVEDHPS